MLPSSTMRPPVVVVYAALLETLSEAKPAMHKTIGIMGVSDGCNAFKNVGNCFQRLLLAPENG